MTIRIVCSGCRAVYQLPDNLLGKKVKCRHCQQLFVATPERDAVELPAETNVQPRPATTPPLRAEEPPAPTPPRQKSPPPEVETADVPAAVADEHEENEAADRDEQPVVARRRASYADDEDEDEAPHPRTKKRRRSKGHLVGLVILGAALVMVVVLGVGALAAVLLYATYFADNASSQAPGGPPKYPQQLMENPIIQGQQERPVVERQPDLEAYYRMPAEPPLPGLEFNEPPDSTAGTQEVDGPRPIKNTTGQLTPEVLQKVKEATVYLRVRMQQGEGEGSGYYGGERGIVLTNAHVVGMLSPGATVPSSITVVRNKGEKNEISFPAEVVAVDPTVDLALLKVPKEGQPEPLLVKSAEHLQETQPIFVAGFPLGELPGKSITINKYEVSSLKKEKGVLDKLQIHGDMQPGNSGGPVVDGDGEVIGMCVSILRGTRINFAIPGDKVRGFLNGRLADLTLETPARVEGRLQVPVALKMIDPLGRVGRVNLDLWTGKIDAVRQGSRTAPEPQPGDGPRQTLVLDVQQQRGRGDLVLPPLPAGQAYWLQPSLVYRTGGQVWLSARVYQPSPPVERKPATLILKPAGDWPLLLERWSSLQFPDAGGRDHRALLSLETRLTDTAKGAKGNGLALDRHFTALKEGVTLDGTPYMTRRLRNLGPNMQFIVGNRAVDAQGTVTHDDIATNQIIEAPLQARHDLQVFGEEMEKFLQGLEVALPGKQVQPGETWKARRPLGTDPTWKVIEVLPAPIWSSVDADSLEVTYTYAGVRTVNGVEQGVINLKGQSVQPAGAGSGSGRRLSGTAVVDLSTGQIIEEEVTMQATLELVFLNVSTIKAHGTVVTRLRRE